jgi:mannose/fructose/N-acetylgalactosamine-specific phosphotransferase system component IIB
MIKLTRIDDRLVHGQVAFTWTPALGIDCLLVANDKVAGDEFLKMTMGLAKPASVKLMLTSVKEAIVFLNDAKSKHLKILLIIDSVKDAYAISNETPDIQSINFGGIRGKEGSRPISKAISLTDADIALVRELLKKGVELEVRQVPTDKKQLVENLI